MRFARVGGGRPGWEGVGREQPRSVAGGEGGWGGCGGPVEKAGGGLARRYLVMRM